MLKPYKFALAVAGLISIQAVAAFAEGVPNDAIPQADFKVRGGAGYTNHRGGFVIPGAWYGPVVYTTPVMTSNSVYVPPAVAVNARQSYQSFAFEPGVGPVLPAPVIYTAPLPRAWDPLYFNTPPKFYDANRKINGKDFGY